MKIPMNETCFFEVPDVLSFHYGQNKKILLGKFFSTSVFLEGGIEGIKMIPNN